MGRRDWYPIEPLITPGGDVGGDIQAGDSYEVRLWRDDKPNLVITVWTYPVKAVSGYAVQTRTEFMMCRDRRSPGDTEEWSDVEYDDSMCDGYSLSEAQQMAKQQADELARTGRGGIGYEWDGETR